MLSDRRFERLEKDTHHSGPRSLARALSECGMLFMMVLVCFGPTRHRYAYVVRPSYLPSPPLPPRSSLHPKAGSGVSELLDDRLENLKLELKASEKTCQALLPNVAAFTKGTREVRCMPRRVLQ